MKPELQNIAIERIKQKDNSLAEIDSPHYCLPNYTGDLNAMHEAEKSLKTTGKWMEYVKELERVILMDMNGTSIWVMHCATDPEKITHGLINYIAATAAQRAEAYLRTIGKWVETGDDK